MSFFTYLFAFAFLLTLLVFVHELGHFLVARACGVRVLKFSIGFGPPIGIGRHRLAWKRGGTEWVIAWIPLGGFVKMLGENPDEADDPEVAVHPGESLPEKRTWQKLAIVSAGPIANLILPVVIFVGALAVGLPRPMAVIGSVEAGSPAAEVGLVPGDRVTALDGEPVSWWGDLEEAVREQAGKSVSVTYERGGERRTTQLSIVTRTSADELGGMIDVGWAGFEHPRLSAMLGIASAAAPAHAAGLRSGDVVESVNGAPVEDWNGLERAYAAAGRGGDVLLGVRRAANGSSARSEQGREGEEPSEDRTGLPAARRNVRVPALGSLEALGVLPANVLIQGVSANSAADKGGLRPGDLILSVDGEPIRSFTSFAELVRTSGGRPLVLRYARDGELRETTITPELVPFDVGFGIKEPRYLVGISAEVASLPGEVGLDRERNPVAAVPRAVDMTLDYTRTFLAGLAKLVTGEVDRKQLAGPIGIAEIAGSAFQRGWETYLSVVVLISINLGILNLLPIPVLDGGQAVIFAVEGIRRAPLSLRTREIVQQIGLTVLMLLMGFAFWNDLARQWTRLLDWLASRT